MSVPIRSSPPQRLSRTRPALARARAVYLGEEAESWDDLAPRPCSEFLAHMITESYSS
ncbi:hypothetical protein STAFG_7524 [Streptomyces afghaniensis 772]|uniref:Uncharacterized protein n=1 Tax=Streptomyces afghaniensis 772 TaxID=1283301 RepID=S4MG29_9ACTN|nr:hypothetical protein [Streptomyces afghaniensis]EPJ35456.1 hypothetical protein STAFG_7524 [Streptomyces afghaniensis 772]